MHSRPFPGLAPLPILPLDIGVHGSVDIRAPHRPTYCLKPLTQLSTAFVNEVIEDNYLNEFLPSKRRKVGEIAEDSHTQAIYFHHKHGSNAFIPQELLEEVIANDIHETQRNSSPQFLANSMYSMRWGARTLVLSPAGSCCEQLYVWLLGSKDTLQRKAKYTFSSSIRLITASRRTYGGEEEPAIAVVAGKDCIILRLRAGFKKPLSTSTKSRDESDALFKITFTLDQTFRFESDILSVALNPLLSEPEAVIATSDCAIYVWEAQRKANVLRRISPPLNGTLSWRCLEFTASARAIYVVDKRSVEELDFSTSATQRRVLFPLKRRTTDYQADASVLKANESIIAFARHPAERFHYVVVTTTHVILMDSRDTTRPLLKWKHILNGIVGDLDYRPTFVWLDTDGDSRNLVMLSGGKFGGIRVWQYDYEIDTPEDSDEAVAALADLIFDVNNHNSQKWEIALDKVASNFSSERFSFGPTAPRLACLPDKLPSFFSVTQDLQIRKFESAPTGIVSCRPIGVAKASEQIVVFHSSAAGDLFAQRCQLADEEEMKEVDVSKLTSKHELRLAERDLKSPPIQAMSNHSYADLSGLFKYMIAPLRVDKDEEARELEQQEPGAQSSKMPINDWRREQIIDNLKEYLDVPRTRYEAIEWAISRYSRFFTVDSARTFINNLVNSDDFMERIYAVRVGSAGASASSNTPLHFRQRKKGGRHNSGSRSSSSSDDDSSSGNEEEEEELHPQVHPVRKDDFHLVLYGRPFLKFSDDDDDASKEAQPPPPQLDPELSRWEKIFTPQSGSVLSQQQRERLLALLRKRSAVPLDEDEDLFAVNRGKKNPKLNKSSQGELDSLRRSMEESFLSMTQDKTIAIDSTPLAESVRPNLESMSVPATPYQAPRSVSARNSTRVVLAGDAQTVAEQVEATPSRPKPTPARIPPAMLSPMPFVQQPNYSDDFTHIPATTPVSRNRRASILPTFGRPTPVSPSLPASPSSSQESSSQPPSQPAFGFGSQSFLAESSQSSQSFWFSSLDNVPVFGSPAPSPFGAPASQRPTSSTQQTSSQTLNRSQDGFAIPSAPFRKRPSSIRQSSQPSFDQLEPFDDM